MKKGFTRETTYLAVVIVIFGVIISRLIYVQIINGDYYNQVVQAMGEKPIYSVASRGEILDSNYEKIAANRLSYSIVYSSQQKRQGEKELNNSLINAVNIIFTNNDQSSIITNILPINYNEKTKTFNYKLNTNNTVELVKEAKNFKIKYNVKTSFDKSFDYKLIDDFENKYDLSPTEKEIQEFENSNLKYFDENKDVQEAITQLAIKYNLLGYDDAGNIINVYKLPEDKLFYLVALRTNLQSIIYSQYKDVDLAKDVKKETAWEIQIKNNEVQGITSQVVPIRYYPFGEVGSNFIGYLGKISKNVSDKYTALGYDTNRDLIGINGLEKTLENRENNDLNIQLRGQSGVEYVKVDKFGKIIEETGKLSPMPGDTVVTTIDMGLQKAAEQALDSTMKDLQNGKFGKKYPNATRGAIVVMDVNTGGVLALVSRPGFNPNDFAETGLPKDPAAIKKYLLDNPPEVQNDINDLIPHPMYDYATQGSAPPGSTFKPLTAIAGLQEGVIDENTTVNDTGIYTKDGGSIKCWIYDEIGRGHGPENVVSALENSCNFFFNEVGNRLGIKGLTKWASLFGLTRDTVTGQLPPTGIEISETPGVVGDKQTLNQSAADNTMRGIVNKLKILQYGGYTLDGNSNEYHVIRQMLLNENYDMKNSEDKQKVESILSSECGITNKNAVNFIESQMKYVKEQAFRPVDVLYMAMGQGYVSLTPLQMAQMISTIVNGGKRYQAHLIKEVLNPDGSVKEEIKPKALASIDLDPKNVEAVMKGMARVDSEGTAAGIFKNYPIRTGGKTGTAESGKPAPREAYGWFLGVAPLDKPKIVVSAVIYDAGHGYYAGEAVKAVYDYYFRNEIQNMKNAGK